MKKNTPVFLVTSGRGTVCGLLLLLSCPGLTASDPASVPQNPSASGVELGQTETKKLELTSVEITDMIAKGMRRATEKQFSEAFALFEQADAAIKKSKTTALMTELQQKLSIIRAGVQKQYGEQLYSQAKNEYLQLLSKPNGEAAAEKSKQIKEMLNNSKNAYYLGAVPGRGVDNEQLEAKIEKDPLFAQRVEILSADCDKIQGNHDFALKTNLNEIDPNYHRRQDDINRLFRQGENLYKNKQYTMARDKMEQILIKDPYNEKAIRQLEKIYKKLYSIADMRQYNEMLRDQAETEWRWMENIPRDKRIIPNRAPKEFDSGSSALYDKLNRVMIDKVSFIDADVNSAIQHLRLKYQEKDSEGPLNVIFNNPEQHAGKRVTLELEGIPFLEAIRYLCQVANLQYKINERDKALIVGAATGIEEMETRFIPVRNTIINGIVHSMGSSEEGAAKDDSGKDSFSVEDAMKDSSLEDTFKNAGEKLGKTQKVTSEALRQYFTDLGIPFEEGSKIAYDTRANKLTVRNTQENLRTLELLIRERDIQDPLVLIESKIMEIKMNDLEELGFDWTLTHDNERNPKWNFSITSPLRETGFTSNTLINNMNILPNFGGDNVWSLFLTVNALDRTDRTEILSTPKVIAKSGVTATIRMVREMYFPDSWTDPEIDTSCGSSISFTPSYPEFGDAEDIGITFTVTPTVSPNNYTIRLDLNPMVKELSGWTDYSYNILMGDFGRDGNYKVTLIMPERSIRSVETKIKVFDGQTVLLGGILSDKQSFVDDRWPFLGDIPILGRLFSNYQQSIEKVNLLISVTPRLISGDGVPVRSNSANGLPDFRR